MIDEIGIEDASKDPALIASARRLARLGERKFYENLAILSEALISKEPEDIPTWCEQNLFVPPEKTTRGGAMVLTPIQREIARFCQDPFVSQVTFLKPTRIGSSFLNAALKLYYGCHEASDTIFYERTEGACQDFSNDKLIPIWESSVSVANLLRKASKHGIQDRWTDRVLMNGASMKLRSVEVNGSFRAIRGRFIIADEAGDPSYRAFGKKSEGSKVDLIKRRGQEFADFTLYLGGTPTRVGECTVSEEYEKSDKRKFVMTFPCCGASLPFVPDVRRAKDKETPYGPGLRYLVDENGDPCDVWYECEECGSHVAEAEKVSMMETGKFERTPGVKGARGHVGVYCWAAHSTDPQSGWTEIAEMHAAAEKDVNLQQSFTNTWLALPWEEPVDRVMEQSELQKRIEDCKGADAPSWSRFLYAAYDIQEGNDTDRLYREGRVEMLVYAVGRNRKRCVIDRQIISKIDEIDPETGEIETFAVRPMSAACETLLWESMRTKYRTADGRTLGIRRAHMDANFMSHEVTEFCAKPKSVRLGIKAIKSKREGYQRHDFLPAKEKLSFKNKRPYIHLGTQTGKDSLFRTLTIPPPAPNSWTFHPKFAEDDAFFRSLLAEHKVKKSDGSWRWERIDRLETGEVWDMMVYAYAAELWDRRENVNIDHVIRQIDEALEEALIVRDAEVRKAEERSAKKTEEKSVEPTVTSVPQPDDDSDTAGSAPDDEPTRPRFGLIRRGGRVGGEDRQTESKPAPRERREPGPLSQMPGIW